VSSGASAASARAIYTTERDLNDLDAVLARHNHDETAEIRRILAQRRLQARRASAGAGPGGGRD
jgi:hypothetical protein